MPRDPAGQARLTLVNKSPFAKKIRRYANLIILAVIFVVFAASATRIFSAEQASSFREDLRPYGFLTSGSFIGGSTNISFLSNDLLLVTVNQFDYHGSRIVRFPLGDQPLSRLLLFSVSQKALLKSKYMPVEKSEGSVRAIAGAKFVLLNESGLRVCTSDLECGSPTPASGSVLVSPRQTRFAVGNYGSSKQLLYDAASVHILESFPPEAEIISPGDDGLLASQRGKPYLRLVGQPDRELTFACCAFQPLGSFLNDTTIAGFESNKVLAVEKTDGTVLFRVPLHVYGNGRVEMRPAAAADRFCLQVLGWTTLNLAANLGFEDENFNSERIEVLSTDSGKVLFELHGNPRPYIDRLATPALSPNGRTLARISMVFWRSLRFRKNQ